MKHGILEYRFVHRMMVCILDTFVFLQLTDRRQKLKNNDVLHEKLIDIRHKVFWMNRHEKNTRLFDSVTFVTS